MNAIPKVSEDRRPATVSKAPRVLVVEDDADYALLVVEALEAGGRFDPVVAADARAARAQSSAEFSAIVLDHNLPDATGLDLLPEIVGACEVPVIMLTGENVVETAVRSIQAGAFSYLVKTAENLEVLPEIVGQAVEETRRRRERREMQAQMRRAENLAGLGSLSMGMCHEMNNPLAGVVGYADMYLRGFETDARKCMEAILASAYRLRDVVKSLASFASGSAPPQEKVDLAALAREELKRQEPQFDAGGVAVTQDLPEGRLEVAGSGPGLGQVLHHVLRNARQAVEGSETKVVAVRVRLVGDFVRVEVEDTGSGVPEEIAGRIFDPFFTTRDPNKGMGMGLAISHRIIDQHGGRIRCEAGASGGALFVVEIPVSPTVPDEAAVEQGGPDV